MISIRTGSITMFTFLKRREALQIEYCVRIPMSAVRFCCLTAFMYRK